MHKWPQYLEDFGNLWERCNRRLNTEELELIAIIMRRLWLRWNGVVFRNQWKESQLTLATAQHDLEEFRLAMSEPVLVQGHLQQAQPMARNQIKWMPPDQEVIKLNWDAAVSSAQQSMGIGLVIQVFLEKVWACLCLSRPFYSSLVIAECLDLLKALDFCIDCGFWSVVLEGDAHIITHALNREDECLVSYGELIEEAKSKMKNKSHWRVSYILREGNGVAPSVAKYGLTISIEIVRINEVPDFFILRCNGRLALLI